jgi:hypothetical protein
MAFTTTATYAQGFLAAALAITNSTGTTITATSPATTTTNGGIFDQIIVTSTDTSARDLILYAYDGTTNHQLGVVSIPAGAGNTDNVPSVMYLQVAQMANLVKDAMGNPVIKLPPTWSLQFSTPVAVTSGKTMSIFVGGEPL